MNSFNGNIFLELTSWNVAQDQVEHGVTTVFVKLDNTNIELLLPLGEKSPIGNFLKKKPDGGVHHVCLEVSYPKVPSSNTIYSIR